MMTLDKIFEKRIFRIPDYQRGYAWGALQLNDLWQDIENLRKNILPHYMGMISVEPIKDRIRIIDEDERNKFENSKTFEEHNYFHVIDGQQRLLSIIIMLHSFIEQLDENEIYNNLTKRELLDKFIFRELPDNSIFFIFGYQKDDPSNNFLINKIFGQKISSILNNTAYTKNLLNAKEFFTKKISELNKFEITDKSIDYLQNQNIGLDIISKIIDLRDKLKNEDNKKEIKFKDENDLINGLSTKINKNIVIEKKHIFIEAFKKDEKVEFFNIITNRLMFDFNEFTDMAISMIFETMNRRGKQLTNLELLKNRLIYLISLKDIKESQKIEITDIISKTWKNIYYYLGRNQDNILPDDAFLKNHWIMFHRFNNKEAEYHKLDIFNRIFTTSNETTTALKIEEYSKSLNASIPNWFKIYNPYNEYTINELKIDKEIAFWLYKLNIIGFKSFVPIILQALVNNEPKNKIVELLKAIESHVFLFFLVSYRKANTGTYHFYNQANKYFKGEFSLEMIINDIKFEWTYGNNENIKSLVDLDFFKRYLDELFENTKYNGFLDWKTGLEYFLHEYEISLNNDLEISDDFSKFEIELIFPQSDNYDKRPDSWEKEFIYYSSKEKRNLCYSLGNMIIVNKRTKKEKEKIQNSSFEDRREIYENGLYNEQELLNYKKWTASSILKRGIKLLEFMENRWNISFKKNYLNKKDFLFIDFVIENEEDANDIKIEEEDFDDISDIDIDYI